MAKRRKHKARKKKTIGRKKHHVKKRAVRRKRISGYVKKHQRWGHVKSHERKVAKPHRKKRRKRSHSISGGLLSSIIKI